MEELARRKDPRAVLPLVMALGAWNVSVRVAAARTLMVLEDPATVGPLIEAMGSEYKPVREAAAWALVKIGDSRAFDPMIKALEDGYDPVRVAAAYALGGLGDPRAVDPLVRALGDWHYGVRRGAAWSLGRIGGGRTVEPLTRALRDSHEDVREAAAWSLAQTGDRRVVGTFVEALFDASPKVRRIAITVLGELGGRKAIDPLISAVGDDEPNVGMAAAQALERFGEPLGKEIFAVLSGDRKARMELARKKDPRTLDPLIRSLRNPNGKVRRAAARALGDIGDPRAIDGLVVLAGGWNLPDRAVALSALMRLKQKGSDRLGLLLRVVNYPSSRAFLIVLAVVAIIVFSWKRQISKINRRAARHASRSAVTSAGQPDPSRRL